MEDLSPMQRVIAASSGAICTAVFMTPLDVVKIRLQNQRHPVHTGECFIYSNGLMDHICRACASPKKKLPCEWYERPGNFTGMLDAFIKIARGEGLRSLWSGLSPTIVMAVPTTAFYFSAYDYLVTHVRAKMRSNSTSSVNFSRYEWAAPILAGSASRATAVTLVAPLEVIRTKMQSEHMSFQEMGQAIRSSLSIHGWRALWLGWVPTLWRDVPFSAVYWCSYEFLKKRAIARKGEETVRLDVWEAFLSGATAGSVAAIITNPFDVAKTRQQIELGKEGNQSQLSMRQSLRAIAREGPASLFAGIVPRVAKVAPACAMMIASYEYFKMYFSHANRKPSST